MPALAEKIKPQLEAKEAEATALFEEYERARDSFVKAGGDTNDPESPAFEDVDAKHKAYAAVAGEVKRLRTQALRAAEMDATTNGAFGDGVRQSGDKSDMDLGGGDPRQWDPEAAVRSLMDSEEYQTLKANGLLNEGSNAAVGGQRRLGEVFDRSQVKNLVRLGGTGSGGTLVVPQQGGYADLPQRRLSLLDVIPTGTADSNLIEYVRQLTRPTSADFVAETTSVTPGAEDGLKPQGTITWERVNRAVHTIAELIPASRQALQDAGQLQALIINELIYDLRRKLEDEVYNGTTDTDGFVGIATDANNAYTRVTGDNIADAIHKGITLVELDNYVVDFVGMSPSTWEKLRLAKDSQNNYYFGPPSIAGAQTIWGYDKVISTVIPNDRVVVGARRGAQLWLRGGVDVFVADQHKDWLQRNVLALLAELRAAFLVTRPDAFAIVNVTAP